MTLAEIAVEIRDAPIIQTPGGINRLLMLHIDLTGLRCNLRQQLAENRYRYLYPKEKTVTELDRKIGLEANTAELERDYEFALKLEEILSMRIQFSVIKEPQI